MTAPTDAERMQEMAAQTTVPPEAAEHAAGLRAFASVMLDRIDELEKQNAELRDELTLTKAAFGSNAGVRRRIRRVGNYDNEKALGVLASKLQASHAENAKLREALEPYFMHWDHEVRGCGELSSIWHTAYTPVSYAQHQSARAALQPEDKQE